MLRQRDQIPNHPQGSPGQANVESQMNVAGGPNGMNAFTIMVACQQIDTFVAFIQ
jgi:hypothetical protein